jgi:hypothetical protein
MEKPKMKFLDTEALLVASSNLTTLSPSTTNPAADAGIIEYVATFPNVTVNAGEQYEACVVTTKDRINMQDRSEFTCGKTRVYRYIIEYNCWC